MKRIINVVRDLPYYLGVFIATSSVCTSAYADAGLVGISTKWKTQMKSAGDIFSMGCGIGGLVMAGAGVMKLKQAADSQTKYGEGLWRLGVGGALCAIPTISNEMQGAVTATDGNASFQTSVQ